MLLTGLFLAAGETRPRQPSSCVSQCLLRLFLWSTTLRGRMDYAGLCRTVQRLCWECRFEAAIRDYNVVYLYTGRQQEDNKTWG